MRPCCLLLYVTLCAATAAGFDVDSFTSGTILTSLSDVEAWRSTHPTTVLAWLSSPQDVPGFKEAAGKLEEVASLAYVTSKDVFPYCEEEDGEPNPRCTAGAIVLEKHGLPFKPYLVQDVLPSPQAIYDWAMSSLEPAVTPFAREFMFSFDEAWKAELDKIIIMLPGASDTWWNEATEAALRHHDLKFILGVPNYDGESMMQMLGVQLEDLPVLMAIEHWSQAKYVKQHAAFRELESFIADYKAGKVPRFIKSEQEDQQHNYTSQVLVGTTITEALIDKPVPALLFIHDIDKCQRCQIVSPIFEEAAGVLNESPDMPDLVVARFNGNANEVPSRAIEYRSYPTIYYVSRGNFLRFYEGPDTVEGLVEFTRTMYQRDDGTVNAVLAEGDDPVMEGLLDDEEDDSTDEEDGIHDEL